MANPNPSPETRFEKGCSGNPGGKTKEQKAKEQESAIMAADMRHKMLSLMQEKVEAGADALEMLDANALKLFKDSEDRAHGTPKSTNEHSGPDGSPIQTQEVSPIDRLRDKIEAIAGREVSGSDES